MHEVRTIATDDPVAWRVTQYVHHAAAQPKNSQRDLGPIWGGLFLN